MEQFTKVKGARIHLLQLSEEKINRVLMALAEEAERSVGLLLEANQQDLDRMPADNPMYDRLQLTEERIKTIASDIRNVAGLPSPIGEVLTRRERPSGLALQKVRVPLGVVGIIYEARPNVTFDVFSLCFKTGNACLLKGGSDAAYSNKAIVALIERVLQREGIDTGVVQLLPTDRSATQALLQATDTVDMIIPRGSQGLINYVRDHAKVPVIETGAGIVHTYIDASADVVKAQQIMLNAKTRRPSVCNALDCAIVHQSRLSELPQMLAGFAEQSVQVFADERAFSVLSGTYPEPLLQPATEAHFGTEFLSLKMAIKTVDSLEEALAHIGRYSSRHSEAIVAESETAQEMFLKLVDAAVVYANASTAFTDGAQFGLGAEIGISTQKLHARGPMALEELTSYKWVAKGDGLTRN